MTIEGVDFSFGRPGAAALAAAGKHFVVRYITGAGKALTAIEASSYRAYGIAIALVFETTAGRALQGGFAGASDAARARDASAALGLGSSPIYFAVDFDASAAQQPAIDAYLKGAASVIGAAKVGVYGGIDVVSRCRANRTAAWFWQTYAWSGGRIASFVHLYQYRNGQTIAGAAVDLCRAYRADFGQWPSPASAVTRWRVVISGGPVRLYAKVGAAVAFGAVSLATYTCTRTKVGGEWWYRIVAGKRTGQAFKPNRFVTARGI